jgi:hypothetical protein
MVLRNSLLGADVTEHVQLLLVFSTHVWFLSGCVVETTEFSGTGPAYSRFEYASKTKKAPPASIRTIECRLLLGTLRTSTVSRPYCANF